MDTGVELRNQHLHACRGRASTRVILRFSGLCRDSPQVRCRGYIGTWAPSDIMLSRTAVKNMELEANSYSIEDVDQLALHNLSQSLTVEAFEASSHSVT